MMKHFGFFSYIKERWVVLISLIAVFVGLLLLLTLFPNKTPDSVETQEIFILNLSLTNWGVWITVIGGILACFWGLYQYDKSKNRSQQEKSCEIAKLFSDELLNKCAIIGSVINKSELGNLLKLKKIDMNNLKRFDKDEISELYENIEINFWEKYKTCLYSKDLQNTYLNLLETNISNKTPDEIRYKSQDYINKEIEQIMSEKYSKNEIENLKSKNLLKSEFEKFYLINHTHKDLNNFYRKDYTDNEAQDLFILDNENLPFKFITLISDVLNELEYICMYISSQSAGTYYIYQSLHQIFLRTVKTLAATIAYYNKNYTDKYYTNIIHVYVEWQEIRMKNDKKEKKKKAKAFKYLEPKIRRI